MKSLICPGCQSILETFKEPDIEYEKCPNCNGLFLDKGELNILATGHSCDVELSFINFEQKAGYNQKICPKCKTKMERVTLGLYSYIYFDICRNCHGYFLDQSKEERINFYLESITQDQSSERYRAYVHNVLVRVDIKMGINSIISNGEMLETGYKGHNYLIISAFYKRPLDIDLFISQEGFVFKIIKMLFGNHKIELYTPDKKFNNLFKIHASSEIKMNLFLSNAILKILEFVEKSPKAYNLHGKLIFYDDRVTYKEGPYTDIPVYRNNENFNSIINDLAAIASIIG